MASVNYMKLHGGTETKAIMRHCDKAERARQQNKANKEIDPAVTRRNIQIPKTYEDTCQEYDARMAWLDSQPGCNKRKDRVTCFSLEIPAPEGLSDKDVPDFFARAYTLIGRQYGAENILQCYVHLDEVHEYKDAETGKTRTSRVHAHVLVVPEHDNKLNGKWFSSKTNMRKLNDAIHAMAAKDFGLAFMDGTKKKTRKTVEELKNESRYCELEANLKEEYAARMLNLNEKDAALRAMEASIRQRKDEVEDYASTREMSIKTRQRDLDEREASLAAREARLARQEEASRRAIRAGQAAMAERMAGSQPAAARGRRLPEIGL